MKKIASPPKEATYNKYGDTARKIEIESLGKHGTCFRGDVSEIPGCCSVIGGRLAYAAKNKSLISGYAKTGGLSAR